MTRKRRNPHKPFEEHLKQTAPMVRFVQDLMEGKPSLRDTLVSMEAKIDALGIIKIKMPDGTTHDMQRDEVFQKLYTESHTHVSVSKLAIGADIAWKLARAIIGMLTATIGGGIAIGKILLPLIHKL